MTERIVNALELVDVDIKQRERLAPYRTLQLAFDPLAEQHPVRQVGQRIVMRKMRDLLVRPSPFSDILDDVEPAFRRVEAAHDSPTDWCTRVFSGSISATYYMCPVPYSAWAPPQRRSGPGPKLFLVLDLCNSSSTPRPL